MKIVWEKSDKAIKKESRQDIEYTLRKVVSIYYSGQLDALRELNKEQKKLK